MKDINSTKVHVAAVAPGFRDFDRFRWVFADFENSLFGNWDGAGVEEGPPSCVNLGSWFLAEIVRRLLLDKCGVHLFSLYLKVYVVQDWSWLRVSH